MTSTVSIGTLQIALNGIKVQVFQKTDRKLTPVSS